ncbi:hypothetical protein [Polynucleobacter sp. UK-Kesae-W10]|uniref:hypothetical protein n=1 Tax=Polynucleobacter sp. UK-Kesae-W10 TaxID=1819738 RepID=UPI001C0CA696|nr:hypothetical protein [Polynucleobacter sp. UK-Kesae-W10]MBU3578003.1 hypothetical protein [Polynucleobacter sp. UK-Kesae-W10]
MESNLIKYLAEVFRNDVHKLHQPAPLTEIHQPNVFLGDQNARQFLVDNKYCLRFDEII